MRSALGVLALVVLVGLGLLWNHTLSPAAWQRDAVRLHLVDPASAVFRGEFMGKGSSTIWCGEVNARNRMGGMAGFTRYVLLIDPLHRDDAESTSIYFEKRRGDAIDESFEGHWVNYCTR